MPDTAVAVITADCAPLALWTADGVVGIVHAGWRGLLSGVIEATAREVQARSLVPHTLQAALGPCIGPCCYEFGASDLDSLLGVYGDVVEAKTNAGTRSLNMWAGVEAAVQRSGGALVGFVSPTAQPTCTACSPGWFSWRKDKATGRQAMAVWMASDDR